MSEDDNWIDMVDVCGHEFQLLQHETTNCLHGLKKYFSYGALSELAGKGCEPFFRFDFYKIVRDPCKIIYLKIILLYLSHVCLFLQSCPYRPLAADEKHKCLSHHVLNSL